MYTMIQTRKAHPSLVIQMVVFVSLGTTVMSTICTQGGGTLNFMFNELDPPAKPTGEHYTSLLLQSGVDNYTIQFSNASSGLSQAYRGSDYFLIQYLSARKGYFISMIKGIDRDGRSPSTTDDVNFLEYQIVCNSTNSSNIKSTLKIQIVDVNDNSPVFSSSKFTTSTRELTETGLVIYDISSTDRDNGLNKQASYSLSSSPGAMFDGSKYFTIGTAGHGSVVVTAYLDFESMYVAANYQTSQVYYNVTITATDMGNRSASTILIINIGDDDDQGPGFVYPSCITSSDKLKLPTCIRPRYRSSISSDTALVTSLQITPDPADVTDPGNPINIIMQDEDTFNASVICNVSNTIPDGYTHLFRTRSVQLGQTKQYKCDVLYAPDVNTSIGSLAEIEVIIKAQETESYKRFEYASIAVTIEGSFSSYCPAGYTTQLTDLEEVICTAEPEKDTTVVLGLGITLGVTVLIIIVLIISGVVMLKRRKSASHCNNTVQMTQQHGQTSDCIYSNGTDSATPGYQNDYSGQSDEQTDPRYQSQHIYDDLIDGSLIKRVRDLQESSGYANVTAEV